MRKSRLTEVTKQAHTRDELKSVQLFTPHSLVLNTGMWKTLEKSHQLCWGNGLGGYLSGYSLPRGQWHASLIANTPTQLTSLNLSVVPTMQPPLCSNSKSSVHPIWIAQGAFVKFESKNLKLVLKERFLTVPAWGIWTMPGGRTVPWDMRELQSV